MVNKGLAELAKERDERIREPVSVETKFNSDPDAVMAKLAEQAYPNDKAEQARYAEKIKASLEEHLRVSVAELWKYLDRHDCKTAAIIEGILRFYAGEKGKFEIGVGRFLKSAVFSAESNLDKTMTGEAMEALKKNTREQLTSLLAEIRSGNPNMPDLPEVA
ncbi:MAG TPA: hypothetical protein VI588_01480 [Candidatus Gracilibacteria bacterium]|nr:hypothetical protein [Candidatus Gracilibacteria bacterium]